MFLTAIVFIIILSLLVMIHELGHFLVARLFGVHVEEFGLGFPPRIFGKKIGRTLYSLNMLPIGGFVKLAGEDEEDHHIDKGLKKDEYFWAKSKKQKTAILLAGVAMNFVLAVLLSTYLFTQGVPEPTGKVIVEKISPGSPAETASLLVGDQIVALEGSTIDSVRDLIETTREHVGKEIAIDIQRGETPMKVVLTPRVDPPAGEGAMGVAITDVEIKKYSFTEAPVAALALNVNRAKEMFGALGSIILRLFSIGDAPVDVSGPIGIARVTGEAVKFGFNAVIEFMSILSLNLAVINILPIPALDGGRFAFLLLEKVLGKKVKPAFERGAHQIGMIILLGLVLLVSLYDILKIAQGV